MVFVGYVLRHLGPIYMFFASHFPCVSFRAPAYYLYIIFMHMVYFNLQCSWHITKYFTIHYQYKAYYLDLHERTSIHFQK